MRKLLVGLSALFSVSANAAWTPASTVLAVRAYPASTGHYVKISTSSVHASCDTTAPSHGIYYIKDDTGRIVSMLLAAQVSGQKVSFSVSSCVGGYSSVSEVQFGETNWGGSVN